MDKTLLIVKPHAVERGLTGEILARIERTGLRIHAVRSVTERADFWEKFYPDDESWFRNAGSKTLENCASTGVDVLSRLGTQNPLEIGKMVKAWLVDHMSSAPAIAAMIVGNEATVKVRKLCGSTLPNLATPGTIRFDFSTDSPTLANDERRPVYNLVHASDPEEVRKGTPAVEFELALLFP